MAGTIAAMVLPLCALAGSFVLLVIAGYTGLFLALAAARLWGGRQTVTAPSAVFP